MIRYINCNILSEKGWLNNSSFCVKEEKFCCIGANRHSDIEVDLSSKFVLPGIIDIHGDSFERCITPRAGVNFPLKNAIYENDNYLLSAGITTFFYSITDSFETGLRSRESAKNLIKILNSLQLKCNSFIHIRHEVANTKRLDELIQWLEDGMIDLLSINDHLPRMQDGDNLQRYINSLKKRVVISDDEIEEFILSLQKEREIGIQQIDTILEVAKRKNIPIACHDDDTMEKVAISLQRGVNIAEFPMNKICTKAFKDAGVYTLFGAPNLIRGRSHVGALSVQEAAREDLLQILCSDYHYPSLYLSPFKLASLKLCSFEDAWKMISLNPAIATKIDKTKGSIKEGKDADFLVLDSLSGNLHDIHAVFIKGKEKLKYND